MNKNGFLLGEETLKIVLAVIAIFFLVYLLVSLYYAGRKSKDLETAEASLNHLIEQVDSMKEGEIGEVEIYNPKGWWLISWPYSDIIPNSCSNIGWESCICICDSRSIGEFFQGERGFAESCDDSICLESDFIVEGEENKIKIEKPPVILEINYDDKLITQKGK